MYSLPTSKVSHKGLSIMLILLVVIFGVSTAQAQSLTIGSVQACAASEVVVPVIGDVIENAGSITLFIAFNTENVSFKSVDNIDPQLQGINYALNQNPVRLVFAWSGVVPVSFLQKKLFDLRFSYSGISSEIIFSSDCEIANNKLEILPVKYYNGNIMSGLPKIELQPKDTLIKPGASATFLVNATNAQNFLWKESIDNGSTWSDLEDGENYVGTHTQELLVQSIPVSFSNNVYSCTVKSMFCNTQTLGAVLTVDNQASINENKNIDQLGATITPNPILTSSVLTFTLPEDGSIEIQILDLLGKVIRRFDNKFYLKGKNTVLLNLVDLSNGNYIGRIIFNSKTTGYVTCLKLVKT